MNKLTIKQVSALFGYSIVTIKSNFNRINNHLKKKYGIYLTKTRENKVNYYSLHEYFDGAIEKYFNGN